jgi:hypothetical protein
MIMTYYVRATGATAVGVYAIVLLLGALAEILIELSLSWRLEANEDSTKEVGYR